MGRRPVGTKAKAKADAETHPTDGVSPENGDKTDISCDSDGGAIKNTTRGLSAAAAAAGTATATAAAAASNSKQERNPLMGLLHYGSESDDEGVETASPAPVTVVAGVGNDATPSTTERSSSDSAMETSNTTDLLPRSWQQCMDQAGVVYFWNTETDETTWELPSGGNPSPPAVTPSPAAERKRDERSPVSTITPAAFAPGTIAVATPEEDRAVASDATSDTASEPDEDEEENNNGLGKKGVANAGKVPDADRVPEQLPVERATGVVTAATGDEGGNIVNTSSSSGTLDDNNSSSGVGGGVIFENKISESSESEQQQQTFAQEGDAVVGAGDREEQSIATPSPAAETAIFGGVDDLLAGIEAELLSGDGGGGGDTSATSAEESKSNEPDFSPLERVAAGLDTRAKEAHDELVMLLTKATAEEEGGGGGGGGGGESRVGGGVYSHCDGMLKLTLELSAVLRSRLSDWNEGGLDGAFLVLKLEEMAAQARSSLGSPSASSEPTSGTDTPTAATEAAQQHKATLSSITMSPCSTEVPDADYSSAAANTTPDAIDTAGATEGTGKDASGGKHCPREETTEGSGDNAQMDVDAKGGKASSDVAAGDNADVSGNASTTAAVAAAAAAAAAAADAEAEAEAARVEQAAEKLRWADEVSAAASAAVAAAAASAQARKKEAKAKAKTKIADRRGSRRRSPHGDGDGQLQVDRDASEDSSEEGIVISKEADSMVSTDGVPVQGGIDLGGVGDEGQEREMEEGEVEEEQEEEGAVSVVAEPVKAADAPVQGNDAGEPGAVVAGDAALPTGWSAILDTTQGAYYYHNLVTDETTWVLPVETPAVSPPARQVVVELDRKASSSSSGTGSADVVDSKGVVSNDEVVEGRKESSPRKRSGSRRRRESGDRDEKPDQKKPTTSGRKDAKPTKEPGKSGSTGVAGAKRLADKENVAAALDGAGGAAVAAEPEAMSTTDDALQSPWVAVWDKANKAYYYHNTETDDTSWERPAPPAAKSSAVPALTAEDAPLVTSAVEAAVSQCATSPSNNVSTVASVSETGDTAPPERRNSPPPATVAAEPPAAENVTASVKAASSAAATTADVRPCTLVWWSDAGDVWDGPSLSAILTGYGPRRFRNLGGGYYMTTFELGPEWAASAASALGQGVADPAAAARVDWVPCTASALGYGLFLRWAGDDDEIKLFDVPDEFFDDPPPDPAILEAEQAAAAHAAAQAAARAAAIAEEESAAENAEADAAAAAAVAATEEAEAAGSEAAAAIAAAAAAVAAAEAEAESSKGKEVPPPTAGTTTKKRKSGKGMSSAGALGKKRKGAASLIDKWKAVASTAGEEAEREAEKEAEKLKMERWKTRAAAADPDNPNFMPLGRKRR